MFNALRSLVRRHPAPAGRQLATACAAAWEALLTAHRQQAGQFARVLGSHLSPEDALDRYFLELPVPRPMQDAVRAGVLAAMAGSEPMPAAEGGSAWDLLASPKRLVQQREKLRERSALAAARAAEALAAVHEANALAIEEIIGHVDGAEDAVVQYIRLFDLPTSVAQVVYQQALARLAERELAVESTRAPEAAVVEPEERVAPWLKLIGAGA